MKKVLLFCLLISTSCGFRTVYNQRTRSSQGFPSIKVNVVHNPNINSRTVEAKYSNLLHKQLNAKKNVSNYQYVVNIYLSWQRQGALRKSSGDSSRRDIAMKVNYEIVDKNNEVIEKGKIKTIGSFEITGSRFTNYSSEDSSLDNLIQDSVNDLRNRIAYIY